MQILVDADACPVVGIVEKIAQKNNIPCTLLCDTNHVLNSKYSQVKVIGAGADAVDYALINICKRGDIVVSQDYGVAAMALGKGAYAIHQSGKWYTNDNIDQMLMERHVARKARMGKNKIHLKGSSKRTEDDDRHFEESFLDLLKMAIERYKGTDMIQLKELNVEQFGAIVEFDKLCFPADCWKEEDWKELLEDEQAVYYSMVDDNKIVADVFIYNWGREKEYVKIMNLAVHPEYRKQGLAHKLLSHVTDEMKMLEMKRFCGETRASNSPMQKVFEDCGYKLNVIEENYFENPNESAYKYVLQL